MFHQSSSQVLPFPDKPSAALLMVLNLPMIAGKKKSPFCINGGKKTTRTRNNRAYAIHKIHHQDGYVIDTLHSIAFNYIQLHYTTSYYTLESNTLQLQLHYATFHYSTLHYTTLHYTQLQLHNCTTTQLHSTTLHYTPLH